MPNWNEVLQQVKQIQAQSQAQAQGAFDLVRRSYLDALHKKTGRNIIAYYSGWMSKPIQQTEVTDEDKNGFMMCVHKLDRQRGLDLFLHTPGGSIASTQSIVDYLHKMFGNDIRAIVPQTAMSAGTIMACCCKEILMAKHSNLGPIDPQINGWPAYGVIEEFKRACKEIKDDPSTISMWQAIIGQYRPAFLGQCQNAIDWSNTFVRDQLASVMFSGNRKAKTIASGIVKKLTDFRGNKTHARHIHADECAAIGLCVTMIEDDPELQDLILTVHHSYMHAFQSTPTFKAIENHQGVGIFKHAQVQLQGAS